MPVSSRATVAHGEDRIEGIFIRPLKQTRGLLTLLK